MSEIISFFEKKGNFNNESFYYFLPNFNIEKKKNIGENIIKFKGVTISYLIYWLINKIFLNIFYFIILQLISFSLKENINILIEKKSTIVTDRFKQEILSNGNVFFFHEDKIFQIKCLNTKLSKPENYKCFEIEGKK